MVQRPNVLPRDRVLRVAARAPPLPLKDVTRLHPTSTAKAKSVPYPKLLCVPHSAVAILRRLRNWQPGEIVLDLGSGGGIDVLLSARRVGPTGKAYGLDMTEEMLALAEENKRKSGLTNVEFLKGEIENIPLPDNSVDVIVSNCVINLSGDKDRVLREAFRVLKPGGRFAISDVVVRGEIPQEIRKSIELWVGCVAGALSDAEYQQKLAAAGFEGIEIEATRVYNIEDAHEFLRAAGIDADSIAPKVQDKFISAFVRAKEAGQGRGLLRALLLPGIGKGSSSPSDSPQTAFEETGARPLHSGTSFPPSGPFHRTGSWVPSEHTQLAE